LKVSKGTRGLPDVRINAGRNASMFGGEGMTESSFEDIPGTTLFDGRMSRIGYHLNMLCMSLIKAKNRAAFKADEASYLDRFSLTADQRRAVLERRWNDLLAMGSNVYYLAKLAAVDGLPVAHLSAATAGLSPEDHARMMVGGGRRIDGNRSKRG
jgi:protocatechuate 4,5-dioxygenase alpha chain